MKIYSICILTILLSSVFAAKPNNNGNGNGGGSGNSSDGICLDTGSACVSDIDCGGFCDGISTNSGDACVTDNDCLPNTGRDKGTCVAVEGSCVFPTQSPTSSPTKSPSASPTTSSPTPVPTTATPTTAPPTAVPTTASPTASCTSQTSQFSITLMDMGATPAAERYAQAFAEAKARWEAIILNDVPDYGPASNYGISDWFGGTFGSNTYTGSVDDVVIGYSVEYIDGLYNVLGSAGCRYSDGNGRCISGAMRFEEVDMDRYAIEDAKAIILHEMGHVLGLVGTLGSCGGCGTNYEYPCPAANTQWQAIGTGTPLLVENDGGGGTACYHWEEDTFATTDSSELMTGYFEANKYQPISKVTIGALDDLGVYDVDYCQADEWPFQSPTRRNLRGPQNSPKWEVIQTKTNFNLLDLMQDFPPPQVVGPPHGQGNPDFLF